MRSAHQGRGVRGSVSFMLVLLGHIALVGAALQWGMRTPIEPASAAMEAVMIDLAPTPVAPSISPNDVPPGPVQQEQPPELAIRLPPEPPLELPPVVNALSDLSALPPQEPIVPSAPGAEQTTSPPAVNAPADSRYAARETSAGTRNEAVINWQSVLLGHLERFKRYPRRAERLRQEGVVYVRFSVDRRGSVSNCRLERSSGYAVLDDETLAVVARANPVPPPPPEVVGDPVEVMVPVTFYLGSRVSDASKLHVR